MPAAFSARHNATMCSVKKGYRLATGLGLLGLVLIGSVEAEESFSENEVKAVFLYNFANFVSWPKESRQESSKEFRYCVLDEDMAPILRKVLKDETVQGRPLKVQQENIDADLAECHVLYLGKSSFGGGRGWQLARAALAAHVLTVSDLESFEAHGGMVALVRQDRRVHPRINLDAVEKSALRVSAKLLNLATVVRDTTAVGD